ncbi:MAG: ABC transporter substrate-binding protein [Candidatus Bathyarchaeia archaeon]|nr:ABC transporter substrate-binding protein [Candidatus Bathyarchaeota archaeon]
MLRKEVLAALMVAIFLVGIGAGYALNFLLAPAKEEVGLTGTIKIGVLVALTGGLSSYGEDCKAGWELGEEDVNAFLKAAGATWRIDLEFEDTETSPEVTLTKFETLLSRGIKIVLGPMASGEVLAIKERAEAENVLIISPSSTAVQLAIPGDNIFRFVAVDTWQGAAIAKMIHSLGITHIVSVYLSNPWGEGLDLAVSNRFTELGGTVVAHIPFPSTFDPAALAEQIKSKVEETIAGGVSKKKIGIFLASYGEAVQIFSHAAGYPILSEVRWFGTDGTVMLPEIADLTEHPTETRFALATNFTSTIFKITETPKFEYVKSEIKKKLGREPTVYAYGSYDSVWVVALALAVVNKYDAMKIKEVLPQVASSYYGAMGNIMLDENGDYSGADFSLWRPVEVNGVVEWREVGVYRSATDTVEWLV